MRIGYDISQTGTAKAGCGYFAYSLIQHLGQVDRENEYILYSTFGDFYLDSRMSDVCPIRQANFRNGLHHKTLHEAQAFWRNLNADAESLLGGPDVLHANNFYCPVGLHHARLVYTLYDLGFLENPIWTTEQNRTGCFQGVFNASVHADMIVAISAYSRQHFLETFPHYPPERVVVVYPASRYGESGALRKAKSMEALRPGEFWLSVGTLEPRKNHHRLLQAYARLKAVNGATFPLVLAGGKGWLMEGFEEQVRDLGLENDIVVTGYVEDDALRWLYQHCFALVYPSLFEGFGLPVLEAMTLGAPVITSNATSIPEIVGTAGLLVDPMNDDEIFQAMARLSSDSGLHHALRDAGQQRARIFSWRNAAEEVLGLYQQALALPKLNSLNRDSLPSAT